MENRLFLKLNLTGEFRTEFSRYWAPLSKVERGIMEKMEALGTSLKDWNISMNFGVKTGYNAAFIVDTETRNQLVKQDPSSETLLKPILRGRDIERYRAIWAEQWLITTFPSLRLDISNYPAIKQYLASFGIERLEQSGNRNSRKKTPHSWFELQDTCAYHELFSLEKIVWIQLVDKGRFAFDQECMIPEASTCFLTGTHLEYLLAVLNSTLISWYVSKSAPVSGQGTRQWKIQYIKEIPVVEPALNAMSQVVQLVRQIISRKGTAVQFQQSIGNSIVRTIDDLIFDIYELDSQERRVLSCS